jgi:hypothetical protein
MTIDLGTEKYSILEEAQTLIHGERNKNYGHPRENFRDIAALFGAYFGIEVTDLDVANLMILVKVARVKGTGYHRDSFTDIAGYAGCAERIYEEEDTSDSPTIPAPQDALESEPIADWEKELLEQHTSSRVSDSFFLSHINQPAQPRVWESKQDIPRDGTKARSAGGEVWKWYPECNDWLWGNYGGPVNYNKIGQGPFTEALEDN